MKNLIEEQEKILANYIKWTSFFKDNTKPEDMDKLYHKASRIASEYTENELRLALVMRASYDKHKDKSNKNVNGRFKVREDW